MPGLDSLLGVWNTKAVKGRPREQEARELLEKIANQVKPICVAHRWKVQMLEEFVPPNAGLLGMNVGRQKIFIRLRPAGALGSFYPYEALLHTMLHELVHMEIGPHNAKFYKMLDELRDECEKLIREGITGNNMPFAGDGRSLGGGRAPIDARAAALKAAERRQRQQNVMGGGQRLGGMAVTTGNAAERAAAAAEWRQAVSRGCATTGAGGCHGGDGAKGCSSAAASPSLGGSGDNHDDEHGWDCELCTLHNSSVKATACEACGTLRPVDAPVRAAGHGASKMPAPHGRGHSHGEGTVNDGEKHSRTSTARGSNVGVGTASGSTSVAAAAASVRSTPRNGSLQKQRLHPNVGTNRTPIHGVTSSSRSGVSSGRGSSVGKPVLGTWTCRKCPFAFPNPAERETCESCGAPKRNGGEISADDDSTGRRNSDELWRCSLCTVINAGTSRVCSTCETPRGDNSISNNDHSLGASAETVYGNFHENSDNDARVQFSPMAASSSSHGVRTVGRAPQSSMVRRACRVCTLRNHAQAVVCAACGIQLAESEAAVRTAAMEVDLAGSGEGGGIVGSVALPNEADVIDLS